MAISITKQPNKISWSRNQIPFEFLTDKVVLDNGRSLVLYLDFSNVENIASVYDWANDVWLYKDWNFTLSIGRSIFQFACEYYPREDRYSIPHRIVDPSEPKTLWLNRVCASLIANYGMDNYFDLNVEGEKIKIKSKKTVSNDITIQNGDAESIVAFSISETYVPISFTPNLKIFVELFIVDDSGPKSIVSAALAPDLNGRASWDLSLPLSSVCLSRGNDRPDFKSISIQKGKTICKYFLQVTELYGEPQATKMTLKSSEFVVVYGGLPRELSHLSFVNSIVIGDQANFLTTSSSKNVTTDQVNWISWFNPFEDLSNVEVKVRVIFSDESVYIFTAFSFELIEKFEKIIIPIGLDQINANSLFPELSIEQYSIKLHAGGKQITPEYTFNVLTDSPGYVRFFLYQNSLGAYETIFSYGKKSISYDIEKNSSAISQDNDLLENGENIDFGISLLEKVKVNTGFKSQDEIKAMRDFFLSRDKLMYADGRWWPVSISSSSIDEAADGNGLYALSFEVTSQNPQELFFEK
ncbi:hypothetical protein [Sphingobacterium siyangense]|uniref:hypothetical protein n=1 Tax=Sphingobacterium siyangense TaxID=459529 RepID=UPI003DA4433A